MPMPLTEEQRQKMRARSAASYQRNRERVLQKSREYYQTHREEKAKLSKAWAEKNPEKRMEYVRKYQSNNRDKCRAACRAWQQSNIESERARWREKQKKAYALNPKLLLQRNREWREKNSIALAAQQKDYRLKNLTKRRASQREWNRTHGKAWRKKYFQDHPGLQVAMTAKRRALKKAAVVNLRAINAWIEEVKSKPFATCYYCQEKIPAKSIHFDHIEALSKGGAHSVENLCVSCATCNLSKSNKEITAWVKIGQQVLSL